ncbi:MAG TPA: hypothetical protein VGL77_02900 [Armatimonadota bacterium]|jgi:hypothetical protein
MTSHDREILRTLARRVAEIAAWPEMAEKRALWKRHNDLQPTRPLVLIFPEGAWAELLPDAAIQCEDAQARSLERQLRERIYTAEHFSCDNVTENRVVVNTVVNNSGWGLEMKSHARTEERGSWSFDPVINTPDDLKKLRVPELSVDEAATAVRLALLQDLFGDILDVQQKSVAHISFHLMNQYTGWRGLTETMLDMYEEPEMLHDAMAFMEAGHHQIVRQLIDLNLLSLNNDDTYHSSGGVGYTDALPAPGFDPSHVRPCDMWASAEAQEMAQVSPEQHAEFILPYEKRLLAPFALNGYGCCEDLTRKLDDVFTIPNLRRISISPWADVDACAEKLRGDYIFSWKAHPAHVVGHFDPAQVRDYIAHTVAVAQEQGCVLEMILKDTHTCEFHPERLDAWSQIAYSLATGDERVMAGVDIS